MAGLLLGTVGAAGAQGTSPPTHDPVSGAGLFQAKGCVACHAINGAGGTEGPDLGRTERPRSLYALAATMWNHTCLMQIEARRQHRPWPRLSAAEMADLAALMAR